MQIKTDNQKLHMMGGVIEKIPSITQPDISYWVEKEYINPKRVKAVKRYTNFFSEYDIAKIKLMADFYNMGDTPRVASEKSDKILQSQSFDEINPLSLDSKLYPEKNLCRALLLNSWEYEGTLDGYLSAKKESAAGRKGNLMITIDIEKKGTRYELNSLIRASDGTISRYDGFRPKGKSALSRITRYVLDLDMYFTGNTNVQSIKDIHKDYVGIPKKSP